jgi:hypothetical protein
MIRALRIAASAGCLLIASGCATLPDTQFLTQDYQAQAARFQNAWGECIATSGAGNTLGEREVGQRRVRITHGARPSWWFPHAPSDGVMTKPAIS